MRKLSRVLLAAVAIAAPSHAQWLNHPTPGTPRTRDGKANLAAKAPRDRDGKPDLSGVWHVETTTRDEWSKILGGKEALELEERTDVPGMEITTISKYGLDIFGFQYALFGPKPEPGLMTPAAQAILAHRMSGAERLPSETCRPLAFPLSNLLSEVHKIIQAPGITMMLLELDNSHRQIYTDGRKLPVDPNPSWYGYSIGRWDGDTFVVETNGLNDKAFLDVLGHPRSEAMQMTERYRRRDFGHMDLEMTFNDPKLYTKPFTTRVTFVLQPDTDILESVCNENEKDHAHIEGK